MHMPRICKLLEKKKVVKKGGKLNFDKKDALKGWLAPPLCYTTIQWVTKAWSEGNGECVPFFPYRGA